MGKKQSTIQFLIFGMAIGESIASLPANDQDKVLDQQFDKQLEWGTQVSLSLATTASLTRGYQLADVMAHLQNWYQRRQYAPVGTHQSVDDVTKKALDNYIKNRDMLSAGVSDDAADSDNILARMLPVALYLHHQYGTSFVNDETAMMLLHRIAGLTHNDEGALVTVGMMSLILSQILDGNDLSDAVENGLAFGFEYYSRHQVFVAELSAFDELNLPDFRNIPAEKIVLDGKAASTLEAVIWSLLNSHNYTEAIKNSLVHGHANSVVPTLVAAMAAVYYHDEMVINLSQKFVARRLLATIVSQAERSARFN